jgi:hypothetical protein
MVTTSSAFVVRSCLERTLSLLNPARFYLPAYIGPRGWIGLRMDLPKLNLSEVKELILGSYLQLAPKRLASLVDR